MRTELEAVERYLAEAEARRMDKTSRTTEHQRTELEVTEWGGTEKALKKQKECPELGKKLRRWLFWTAGRTKEERKL